MTFYLIISFFIGAQTRHMSNHSQKFGILRLKRCFYFLAVLYNMPERGENADVIYGENIMKLSSLCGLFLFAFFLSFSNLAFAAAPVAAPQAGKPVQDAPRQTTDRTTIVSVQVDGTDSLGARFATRLKERFNQSSLFRLNSDEEKDTPELRLLLNTAPEFPSRPSVGSVYGVCWVFSQGKGYLGYLLAREIGTVNADDMDSLVDKMVERTDGIAAKYSNLWNK